MRAFLRIVVVDGVFRTKLKRQKEEEAKKPMAKLSLKPEGLRIS